MFITFKWYVVSTFFFDLTFQIYHGQGWIEQDSLFTQIFIDWKDRQMLEYRCDQNTVFIDLSVSCSEGAREARDNESE